MKMAALGKKKSNDDISALRSWWSTKYNKPINAPELLSLTPGVLLSHFYEDLHARRDDIKNDIRRGHGDRNELEEALRRIESVLEIENSLQAWQEEVESALEGGSLPDWAKGLAE